ncbi:endonuclease [Domibacillus antri]|uniref:Endonuclease n=1 Tax=Domibacillus antri TaxID=1714264 RepID=A0A1Q8Q274_9BACI|nr:YqaJ viral recombinase family protein [Domibacillus antri]OLN21422.1 endonuclease [Domibacillus antri]
MFTKADKNVTEHRGKLVGGSDVPAILGISKFATQYELALDKTGIKPAEFKGNEYTEYGNALEPQIRDYINALNETYFRPDTLIDRTKGIRSNTDGYDPEAGLILEIKTHGKTLNIKPYVAQMQLYMYQFEVQIGWLALYERPDNFDVEFDPERLKIEVIERDDEYIERILNAIETFWIRCEFLKDRPDMNATEFMAIGQNEVTVLIDKLAVMERDLMQFKALEAEYKDAKQKLYDAMEEYDIKKFETDFMTITRILPTTSETFDSTKFKKEQPDVAAQYMKTSKKKGYVTIKVKEA